MTHITVIMGWSVTSGNLLRVLVVNLGLILGVVLPARIRRGGAASSPVPAPPPAGGRVGEGLGHTAPHLPQHCPVAPATPQGPGGNSPPPPPPKHWDIGLTVPSTPPFPWSLGLHDGSPWFIFDVPD